MILRAILHNIRSAHNVGSIFRSADALALDKLYLCGYTPTPKDRFGRENKMISKTALGAQNSLPWEHYEKIEDLIEKLKAENFKVVALELHRKAKHYKSFQEEEKLAIILGNEVEGLSEEIISLAGDVAQIPMLGQKESLNVATAFAVAGYGLKNL